MKSKFIVFLIACFISLPVFAQSTGRLISDVQVSNSSPGYITANITYKTGARAVIYNVVGRSDLSTAFINVQKGNIAGTPASYSTVARYTVGAATVNWNNNGFPIFCGDLGYSYRVILNDTATSNLIVNYKYE